MQGETRPGGLLIAAPSSGSGKTVLTLALLRALSNTGHDVSGAKAGPDFIDPAFHALASGRPAVNLDPWAMQPEQIRALANSSDTGLLLIEGMMGLFDGAADGTGSAADLAMLLGVPVVLIVDTAKQSHSVAALVRGFRDHRPGLALAGVILNKVGSARHEALLRQALGELDMPVLGAVHRNSGLELPERHLGLVQAGETLGLEAFIRNAAQLVANQCDLATLAGLFSPLSAALAAADATDTLVLPGIAPLGQRIAIASDEAFSFLYPHLVAGWQSAGAELSFFSPLANEAPELNADAIFLPGGYPELHGGKLSAASNFQSALRTASKAGTLIYGECGGYMAMGEAIIDRDGTAHAMAGLLPLVTSFEKRKLHLGYRQISPLGNSPFPQGMRGHEFHYTSVVREDGEPLFAARDALGADLGCCGLRRDNVMGSYLHLIASEAQ